MVSSGECTVSGLLHSYIRLCFVAYNAASFGREPFPFNDSIVQFGDHEVYVATVKSHVYPRVVHVAADPPAVLAARGRLPTCPASCEIMMTTGIEAGAEKTGADMADGVGKAARKSKPLYEKPENQAGMSSSPIPTMLNHTIAELEKPIEIAEGIDPAEIQKALDDQRRQILYEAEQMAKMRLELDRD